jgi:hypothetical protein
VIETWQYVALGIIVAAFVTVVRYNDKRAADRDDAFFSALESTVADALAIHHFVLASKEYRSESFGHRFWSYEHPPRSTGREVRMFWDGRDREIVVEVRDHDSPTPVRRRIVISGPSPGDRPERYQRALDEVLEAVDVSVKTDGRVI